MKLRAYILHLTRATGRKENAQRLLESCGVDGEIWPAVDGKQLSNSDMAAVVGSRLFEPDYPFPLKVGEVGCFLSHRQIWAEIIRCDLDYGLVFEDDVELDLNTFDEALDLGGRYVSTYGYVQLQNRRPEGPSQLIDRAGDCTLTQPMITPVRASAQLISREAAQSLLKASKKFDRPVDTFVQSHWHTGLKPAVIYPSGVSTISEKLDGSTIQSGHKPLSEKLYREIARFRYRRAVKRFSRYSLASDGADTP